MICGLDSAEDTGKALRAEGPCGEEVCRGVQVKLHTSWGGEW